MKRVFLLFCLVAAAFSVSRAQFGYWPVYDVGYGAFTLMAAMISLTFLWLWMRRETPLSLGMSFSWAGATGVMGWWWIFNLLSQPAAMVESQALFLFLSLSFVGAILHFAAIMRAHDQGLPVFALPVGISLLFAILVELMV